MYSKKKSVVKSCLLAVYSYQKLHGLSDKHWYCLVVAIVYSKKEKCCQILLTDIVFSWKEQHGLFWWFRSMFRQELALHGGCACVSK